MPALPLLARPHPAARDIGRLEMGWPGLAGAGAVYISVGLQLTGYCLIGWLGLGLGAIRKLVSVSVDPGPGNACHDVRD